MKNRWVWCLSGAGLAVLTAAVRLWQRGTAFEPETGLLTPGAPATWCLGGVLALAAAVFFLLGRRCARGEAPRSYLAAFSLPGKGLLAAYILAGGLLVGAGGAGLWERQVGQNTHLSGYLCALLFIPTGIALAVVGWLNTQRQEGRGRFAWPLVVPAYGGCIWLIAAYQTASGNPTVADYAPGLLGVLCAAVSCYGMAAFSCERPRVGYTLWTGGMGMVLLAAAAADGFAAGQIGSQTLAALGYFVYLAVQTACLVFRTEVPAQLEPWVAEEEVETEVTEHEQ